MTAENCMCARGREGRSELLLQGLLKGIGERFDVGEGKGRREIEEART